MIALIVLGVLCTTTGVAAIYVRDSVLDSNEFASRAADALEDERVRSQVADAVTDGLIEAVPELLQVRPLLEVTVDAAVNTSTFRRIFEFAARDLHRTVVGGSTDTVTLELIDFVFLLNTQLAQLSPELAEVIPAAATNVLIEISSGLVTVDAIQLAEEVRALAFILPVLAVLCFGGATMLAAERRRALIWIGFGLVAAAALLIGANQLTRWQIVNQFDADGARVAAGIIWDAFAADVENWAFAMTIIGAAVAGAAWWLEEPLDVRARLQLLRGLVARPERRWQLVVWSIGLIVAGGFLVVRPFSALQLVVTVVGVVAVVNGLAELLRIVAPRPVEAVAASTEPGGWRRWVLPTLGVIVVAGGVAALLVGANRSDRSSDIEAGATPGCNGNVLLCDRPFDEVTFAGTHNSMSAAEDGFTVANHTKGIAEQLEAGYRALLIDAWFGVETPTGLIFTDLPTDSESDRDELVAELGESAVASAEALRARSEAEGAERQVYLCHSFCEIGATPIADELAVIDEFLDANPNEVLVLFIQDMVPPEAIEAAFEDAGLVDRLHIQDIDEPWPTLAEMIEADRRIFVMAENETGDVPWYHDGFAFTQETPFSFETIDDFSCEPNRGNEDSPLFQINHWVTPADPGAAEDVNALDLILERIEECQDERDLTPSIFAVDYWETGDTLAAVRLINGISATADV